MPEAPHQMCGTKCRLLAAMVFVYILLFELLFFFYPMSYTPLVLVAKVGLPLALLAAAASRLGDLLVQRQALIFTLLLFAFMAWGLVATLLGRSPAEGAAEWLKHMTRVGYFVALVVLFRRFPGLLPRLTALIVGWGLFSVAQYVGMVATGAWSNPVLIGGLPVPFGGPLGMFGNTAAVVYLPGFPAVVRFAGWWNEPANASAYMLAAAFLASSRASGRRRAGWRLAALVCGAGGLLALSNAGFVGFGMALVLGAILPGRSRRPTARVGRFVAISVALAFLGLGAAGRWFALTRLDNPYLRAIGGVRSQAAAQDPSAGRLTLADIALRGAEARPTGEGFGYLPEALERQELSASAPIFWLMLAGVPGAVILCLAIGYGLVGAASSASWSRERVRVVQAWTAVVFVQLSYGQWMNPLFLTLAAAALTKPDDSSQRS